MDYMNSNSSTTNTKDITNKVYNKESLENDIEDFKNMMENKMIWKDLVDREQILNGAEIEPIYTLSSYHFWIKRNIVFLNNNDYEILFISGANLVRYNIVTKKMRLFQIKNDSWITSLFTVNNIQGENLAVIGQKTKIIKKEQSEYFPKVEIIFVDNKEKPNITLDFTYYNCSNYHIADSIILPDSEICISLLKNNDHSHSNNKLPGAKIILWEYTSNSYLQSVNVDENLENLQFINYHEFIVYGAYRAEHWTFVSSKKRIQRKQIIWNNESDENIILTCLTKFEFGFIIALSDNTLVVLDKQLLIVQNIDISSHFPSSSNPDEFNLKGKLTGWIRNILYINKSRVLAFFIQGKREILFFEFNCDIQKVELDSKKVSINLTKSKDFNNNLANANNNNLESNLNVITNNASINDNKEEGRVETIHTNKFRNSMASYNKSFHHLLTESNHKLVINNIEITFLKSEQLKDNFTTKSLVLMHSNEDILIFICGESNSTAFLNLFKNKEKSVKDNKNTNIKGRKETSNLKIKYSVYTLNHKAFEHLKLQIENKSNLSIERKSFSSVLRLQDLTNVLKFSHEILPSTAIGHAITHISISCNPRMIIIIYENKTLLIYKQHNIEVKQEDFFLKKNSLLIDDEESLAGKFELIIQTKLEINPIGVELSPYGNSFIISYPEYTYVYGILNKELKEYVKINSSSKAVAYSDSGRYIAFSRSQFTNSNYSIIVMDTNTFEIEYIISNLSHYASKLFFGDNDSVLCAALEDNNMFGWKLDVNREIVQSGTFRDRENSKNKSLKDPNIYFKNLEVTEKILDFVYDFILDTLIIATDEYKIKFFMGKQEDKFFEFRTEEKYTCATLLKKFDLLMFGTEKGTIRTYIWPISKFYAGKTFIDNPFHISNKLHLSKIVRLIVSSDDKYLFSSSEDGSLVISSLTIYNEGEVVKPQSFYYFNTKNILPTTSYMNYSDFTLMTTYNHKEKIIAVQSLKNDIVTKINEFSTTVEKKQSENAKDLEYAKENMNKELNLEREKVKGKERIKEDLSKQLKDTREKDINEFLTKKEELKVNNRKEKEEHQKETKRLTSLIKEINKLLERNEIQLNNEKEYVNHTISENIERILTNLKEKEKQINSFIEKRYKNYQVILAKLEDDYEKELRMIEQAGKKEEEISKDKLVRLDNSIRQIKKKLKDYKEKIEEWEKNKFDLDQNNKELQENLAANTVRLKNMSTLLNDNEKNISDQERIVKKKREINARLEKLRYVLEYQITNLVKEKNPIEEQIKNFEELHNDFYKRFNLLYAEQLNIEECIDNNNSLISNFKNELAKKKTSLYILKNAYNSINLKIGFIFKEDIHDKFSILTKLEIIYKEDLERLEDTHKKEITNENKIQSKILEKEIKKQKNKVLTDLINKRKEIRDVKKEKLDLMQSIQRENTLFIEQCTSIRLNLNDILKNINDIEKKFIELTTTHSYLNKEDTTKLIKEDIKTAKKTILLADSETGHRKNKEKFIQSSKINMSMEENNSLLNYSSYDNNNQNELFKQFELNSEDEQINNKKVKEVGKRIKDILGVDSFNDIGKSGIKESRTSGIGFPKIKELSLNGDTKKVSNKKASSVSSKNNKMSSGKFNILFIIICIYFFTL